MRLQLEIANVSVEKEAVEAFFLGLRSLGFDKWTFLIGLTVIMTFWRADKIVKAVMSQRVELIKHRKALEKLKAKAQVQRDKKQRQLSQSRNIQG